jgi:hypothetical protein
MPTYDVKTPTGNFEVVSDRELSEAEIMQHIQSQPPAPAAHPEAGSNYFERVGRRVGEAGEAAAGIPSAALDTLTGGSKGRLEAGLRLLRGIGSPVEILTSPVEGAVEYAATPYMSEDAARTAGSVAALPFTLGVGLLAKAGKLGQYGQQFAKVLGVGATDAVTQFKRDPQLRYASQLPADAPAEPILEQLVRTSATAEELAMAVKSPTTAEAILNKYRAHGDLWLEQLKETGVAPGAIPASPVLDHKQIMSFEVTRPNDLGLIGTLGTPTTQAAKIHPKGAQVAFEFAEAEMRIKRSLDSRELRNQHALNAVGDKAISDAVKLRNVKNLDEILDAPNINPDVKGVAKFLQDKFDADRGILIPRLRSQEGDRIRAGIERAEAAKPQDKRLTATEIDKAVQARVEKLIPGNTSIDDLLLRVFPTYYRIMDKAGNFLESANNKSEAIAKIKDLADAGGLKASDFTTSHRAVFDAGTLRTFQGRVSRAFESLAKNQGLSPADVEAAIRGDYSLHAPSKFFNQFLGAGHKGMTRDVMNTLNFYDRTLERWIHINDVERQAKPVLRELSERGYRRLTDMLYGSLNALKGQRAPVGEYIDNTLAGIPVVNKLVSPYFLERWTATLKGGIVNGFLKYNPRFQVLNGTQLAQTLSPIADTADIYRAGKGWLAGTSDALLHRHGIKGIGSRVEEFTRGLGPAETMNQQVAFLTMYDKARRLGLSDNQAAAYGRLRGNLFSQFIGLVTDVPKAFRAVDPTGMGLMFQRFPVKQAELVIDLIKNRNFPGVGKWLAVNLALGGMKAATLGQAGWLTLEAYDKIKQQYGEKAADVMHVGLPGLLGVDMSNSVMLYNPPFGEGWAEKVGNQMGGPLGSIMGSVIGAASAKATAIEPEAGKRMFDALVNSIPVGREVNAIAQLLEGDYDLRDPLGRLRYKASMTDLMKKSLGFRPIVEANLDTVISAMMEMKQMRDNTLNYAASRYGQARVAGIPLGEDMQKLVEKEVDNWNQQWPEFPITGDAIATRTRSRERAATQVLRERVMRSMPKVIRDAEQFWLPPGGG